MHYIVFDLEWNQSKTGLEKETKEIPFEIIEIGAVKIKDGVITDRFDELINPGVKLSSKITELTHITDEMLADKDTEERIRPDG